MNRIMLDKIQDIKQEISEEYSDVTRKVNTAATDTYNSIYNSLNSISTVKDKVGVLSDMFTDLRVLNNTAKNIINISTLPVVEHTGILIKDDKVTLDTLVKSSKEYSVKDSSISSIEKYTVSSSGKRSYIEDLFKSDVETVIKFPTERYTFTINLMYSSIEQVNNIELQLGLLTESYPIINSIKYVDKDNVEQTAVILNNTSTSYDLDYNREKDNNYSIDITPVFTNQINIELTSKNKSAITLKKIKTYFKKEVEQANIILGPIHTETPLLKLALNCEELTEGASFEISTDLEYWLKLDSSSVISERTGTKILSFNTINTKSIKTTEDIYTFYIKINLESSVLTNDDLDFNIFDTNREDNILSNDTLELIEDNLFSAYRLRSSDFIHGKYQYIENVNLSTLSLDQIEYIEVNGTPKVLGLVDTPYSITKFKTTNNVGIGGELKYKRLSAEATIDSTTYDLANSKVYDIYCRDIEQTINIKLKDNLCLHLKRSVIKQIKNNPPNKYELKGLVNINLRSRYKIDPLENIVFEFVAIEEEVEEVNHPDYENTEGSLILNNNVGQTLLITLAMNMISISNGGDGGGYFTVVGSQTNTTYYDSIISAFEGYGPEFVTTGMEMGGNTELSNLGITENLGDWVCYKITVSNNSGENLIYKLLPNDLNNVRLG